MDSLRYEDKLYGMSDPVNTVDVCLYLERASNGGQATSCCGSPQHQPLMPAVCVKVIPFAGILLATASERMSKALYQWQQQPLPAFKRQRKDNSTPQHTDTGEQDACWMNGTCTYSHNLEPCS